MNERGIEHETQTRKSRTGLVKVSILRNKNYNQSGTRLTWVMLHNIAAIYRGLKHQDTLQSSLLIHNLKSHGYS